MEINNLREILGLCTALVLLATACTSIEPELPELPDPQPAPVPIDPALYNLSGLISPEEVLDSTFQALQDVGISPLAGDEVDAYQDQQEVRWRAVLAGTELDVFRLDDYLHVRMPVRTIFLEDGADINPAVFSTLELASNILNEFERSVIEIAAHTDGVGSPNYNQELSSRRVKSLISFLEARRVNASRVIEAPVGAASPVGDDRTAAGRELNRRVELTLVPLRAREPEPAVADESSSLSDS